ncbi:alternate signal-mediated exported, CPF_0494 family protein [[Clostridium] bifermentans ATCC 19299]|uniref:BsaA family SipW-dependent biofilm matrix protein n=1 Tax=Paraclostridium bifermentans TaxID=1490 RepID=UPI00038D455A|nr:BsaA family SipW-dependent biofilm matrix protein [Paraclostridium bifermentans]EQK45950.1 alternate signal-mediated exported, CPF_0494 family protein [[Clostridium] bifermentans ATCC 19299] [Paraclostridium bifermentans ATCC 19299]MCR1876236.1 BsaA family SipW-dependent biofilm matrix protein [Paraclostridium bifermentans]
MSRKRIKVGVISILLLICIVTVQKISYASLTSKDKVTNTLNLGDINIEVSETFISPKNWNGDEYSKAVKIKNNSTSPALIRVCIIPRWVDEKGNAWPGDTNLVTLNYETNNITANQNITKNDKWIYGNDNYYYYSSIVAKDKQTTQILKSVSANIPEELQERYKNKTLRVDVKAEAVQATKDAYKKTWNNIENQGIHKMLENLCTR